MVTGDTPQKHRTMSPPQLEITDAGLFRLTENFGYAFPWKRNHRVLIPAGFVTNFASIPWYARWAISKTDPTILIPSLIHDYLVQEHFPEQRFSGEKPIIHITIGNRVKEVTPSWDEAAYIMRRCMKHHTPNANNEWQRFKRFLVLTAVRGHGLTKED